MYPYTAVQGIPSMIPSMSRVKNHFWPCMTRTLHNFAMVFVPSLGTNIRSVLSHRITHPLGLNTQKTQFQTMLSMLSFFLLATVADAFLFASPADGPCCTECKLPEKKFFSVDHGFGHEPFCGETCIDPAKYKGWSLVVIGFYHLFVYTCMYW